MTASNSAKAKTLKGVLGDDPVRGLLVAGLVAYAQRDLAAYPPQDDETMQALGIGAYRLDRYVRPWINSYFRRPAGAKDLLSGKIKTSTKFSALLAFCKPDAEGNA